MPRGPWGRWQGARSPLRRTSPLQIASLLKDNERIQSTQTATPSDEDSDIKKIKKVCTRRPREPPGTVSPVPPPPRQAAPHLP